MTFPHQDMPADPFEAREGSPVYGYGPELPRTGGVNGATAAALGGQPQGGDQQDGDKPSTQPEPTSDQGPNQKPEPEPVGDEDPDDDPE